jgi:hypothetical protein
MVPVMIGTLVANFAASSVTLSIFDIILEFKNFTYLPTLGTVSVYF